MHITAHQSTIAPLIVFSGAAPVNKDEGELIEVLGVMDPEAIGIQPEDIAMEPETEGIIIHPDMEVEGIGVGMDMLLPILHVTAPHNV